MGARNCAAVAFALVAAVLLGSAEGVGSRLRQGGRGPVLTQSKIIGASAANHSGNASNLPMGGASAKVYFLFLAVDKISNLDVWLRFFSTAPASQYKAFVHCKLPSCHASLQPHAAVMQVVPTVPSYYCTDLVSPMNQLLAQAIKSDPAGHPMDKFAFVSDSTLPAKPFFQLHAVLTARAESSFCVFPAQEWADIELSNGGVIEMAPKAHQWLTLGRAHAQLALQKWAAGEDHDFMTRFHMNTQAYTWSNNTFADRRNFGCLDEFWHMSAIYGPIRKDPHKPQSAFYLGNFAGAPLQVSSNAGWQGACDTFVVWSKYLHTPTGVTGAQNPFEKLHAALDAPSIPHGGNNQRPGWWDKISTNGLRAIRWSNFLFVRKFIHNPALTDASSSGGNFASWYNQIVFH